MYDNKNGIYMLVTFCMKHNFEVTFTFQLFNHAQS
jgi:hypothetical protein